MIRQLLIAAALLLAVGGPPAHAVEPTERLADPALEARARNLSKELRCLVCQNQSIDDSNADLAHDLRMIVRERLAAGDSDAEVKAYLVARYGDFVLLDPPFEARTLILWLGPALVLLLGAGGICTALRRRQPAAPAETPLSEAERQRLAEISAAEGAEAEPEQPMGRRG